MKSLCLGRWSAHEAPRAVVGGRLVVGFRKWFGLRHPEQYAWLQEHCPDAWDLLSEIHLETGDWIVYLTFKDDAAAVHFKLRWG